MTMMDYAELDRAAFAGFDAFATGARMPAWVLAEEILTSASHCGHRQAADKAPTHKGNNMPTNEPLAQQVFDIAFGKAKQGTYAATSTNWAF